MARPTKPDHERRSSPVPVRLNIVERAQVEQSAAAHGLNLSEFFRRRVLGVRLPSSKENQQQVAETTTALLRLGVNLNQIAKHLNSGRSPHLQQIGELVQRIDATMDKLDESNRTRARP